MENTVYVDLNCCHLYECHSISLHAKYWMFLYHNLRKTITISLGHNVLQKVLTDGAIEIIPSVGLGGPMNINELKHCQLKGVAGGALTTTLSIPF